jgi:hypothetical protein
MLNDTVAPYINSVTTFDYTYALSRARTLLHFARPYLQAPTWMNVAQLRTGAPLSLSFLTA